MLSLFIVQLSHPWPSLVAQKVKRLPIVRETWFRSLGWEDTLEKEMTTHPSILAWVIPWTEESGGLQSMGLQKSQTQLSMLSPRNDAATHSLAYDQKR